VLERGKKLPDFRRGASKEKFLAMPGLLVGGPDKRGFVICATQVPEQLAQRLVQVLPAGGHIRDALQFPGYEVRFRPLNQLRQKRIPCGAF